MKVALIGTGPHVAVRRAAVRATDGATLAEHLPEATAAGVIQRREAALDVAFVSGAAAAEPGFAVAEAALRQGRHVFLEWPPAASAEELEQLAARAEEAGAEGGVSRPLRFHPLFDAVPESARADVVTVRARLASDSGTRDRRRALSDALDLCGVLAGSRAGRPGAGVRHLDAQAAPAPADEDDNNDARFGAVAAGLRFHGGTYATLELRRAAPDEAAPPDRRLGGAAEAVLDGVEHVLPQQRRVAGDLRADGVGLAPCLHLVARALLFALLLGLVDRLHLPLLPTRVAERPVAAFVARQRQRLVRFESPVALENLAKGFPKRARPRLARPGASRRPQQRTSHQHRGGG